MRVFVTGATGVIGRRLLPLLVEAGHEVTALARRAAGDLAAAGATPIAVDLFDPPAVTSAVDGHDVVVDLATRIPPTRQMASAGSWEDNDRLRSVASGVMADAVLATGVPRYVRESFYGVHADAGAAWVAEGGELDPTPNAVTALDAEAAAQRVTAGGGTGVVLRFGQFYGPDAGHTLDQVRLARRLRLAAFPGDPDGFIPFLHLDDAATAVVAALEVEAGCYVVAAEPASRRAAAEALGAALGHGLWLPPRWSSRFGPLAALDRSIRLDASKLQSSGCWTPAVSDVQDGWRRVVEAIDRAGR